MLIINRLLNKVGFPPRIWYIGGNIYFGLLGERSIQEKVKLFVFNKEC